VRPAEPPVTGLEKEHFKVFDDRVEQTVTHFAMDDEPVAVGLVFDISGSMGPKLRLSRMAAAAFFKTANPEDEFFLVEFNDQPKMVVPLARTSRRSRTSSRSRNPRDARRCWTPSSSRCTR
jgi:Ca-activated chloride channel family protein